ncbi:isocitrate dehydrogenase (NAD) regulatory subunit 1 [Citrus sinensis]|uniref:Isocitrate dehydrogenase (NAD) regulatory subunit 1 n=1 Tax=Citrus sinensis TaxID=2711 RepID=A0ACB8IBT3_CITSI|nr:isocitrate dehydrogenase (NAD) regulatory subunit 1 [Citrus sinensis]KAH9694396.1 isocitrate dehydrogenase (NAD) regulatory subunit 1 [Citrus sinensis]
MSRRSLPFLKSLIQTRSVTYMPRPGDGSPRAVTLIPGDGIGPLVTNAVEQKYEVHGDMKRVPQQVLDSIRKNKVCLKGGLKTPVGGGVSSLNVQLRKELDLYAALVNCFNLPGLPTRHQNVDIVVIRENTEGEYSGLEHEVITKFCSERIAKYAFEYAYLNYRKKVTAVHKANIMKLVATKYPSIKYNEIIVDNCCMQLVTPNLYGNLVSNTAAGIAGGTGVMPGGNVGADTAVFEQGASAGNKANPVALLLSSAMMLRHLQFPSFADRLETAVKRVISEEKYRTKDLGGGCTTQQIVDAVIANLD